MNNFKSAKTIVAVYGAGGFGREVMPLVKDQYGSLFSDVCFVFVHDGEDGEQLINGFPLVAYRALLLSEAKDKYVVLAIADSVARERLAAKCKVDGFKFLPVRAGTVVHLDQVVVGEGAILCNFTHLTSNIKIGKQFHANIYSYIAHDCSIGDYVTFAPGVKCNGNVHIRDHAYIGAGAIIKQGSLLKPLVIGEGAVVGMGAVVTKDVPPGVTVVGNPARPLRTP